MPGAFVLTYGLADELYLPHWSRDGADLSQATLASGDVKVSKDGAAEANIATLPVIAGHLWKYVFSATELQCRQLTIRLEDQDATKQFADDNWVVQTKDHPSAFHKDDLVLYRGTITAGAVGSVTLPAGARPARIDQGSVLSVLSATTGALQTTTVAAGYDSATGVVPLEPDLEIAPSTDAFVAILAAPMTPTVINANQVQVAGSSIGSDRQSVHSRAGKPFLVVSSVLNSLTQMLTDLPAAATNRYRRRGIVAVGGSMDQEMSFIKSSQTSGANTLVVFDEPVTAIPAAGDQWDLM